jgi:hypothetical protein
MVVMTACLSLAGCEREIKGEDPDPTPCEDPAGCDSDAPMDTDGDMTDDTDPSTDPDPDPSDTDVADTDAADTDAGDTDVFVDLCGNAEVDPGEVCDDGVNDGSYNGCLEDCSDFAAYCGDGDINGPEICDDGLNDGSYDGCEPGCVEFAPYCGDGQRNGPEICDDAINDDSCDSCRQDCLEVGSANFLTEIVVDAVPDDYGWPVDATPDIYVVLSNATGTTVWTSDYFQDTDPSVRFIPPDMMVDGGLWRVDVWDSDLDSDDFLGFAEIDTSQGLGQAMGTGDYEDLSVSWMVERLVCD